MTRLSHDHALIRRAQQGDRAAQAELVNSVEAYIRQQAFGYARSARHYDHDDFCSAGREGALRAIVKFNLKFKVRYMTFATYYIQLFMRRLRSDAMSLLSTHGAVNRLGMTRTTRLAHGLDAKGGGNGHVRRNAVNAFRASCFDIDGTDAHGRPLFDPSTDAEQHDETERRQHARRLRAAVRRLPERERLIIERRWLNWRHEADLREIGDDIGLSRERIRQLEQRAFDLLRNELTGAT